MLSGRKALHQIDQTVRRVRTEAVRLDEEISRLVGKSTVAQRRRLELLSEIARIRLSEIENGDLQPELSGADQDVVAILSERTQFIEKLNIRIDHLNQDIETGESERDALLEQCNNVSKRISDSETLVQKKLKSSPDYLAQFERARSAESVSSEAEVKVNQATLDLAEKAQPYQDDALFMYLWRRGYGTTEYQVGLMSRFLDDWVARLINFEPARINYWNLNEIPKRLLEHADRVADLADGEMQSLEAMERAALEEIGVPTLQSELDVLRANLDAHDDRLESKETELNAALSERAKFHSGSDAFLDRCLERISQALQHQSLSALFRYVKQTHSPVDDDMVLELQELQDTLNTLQGDMKSVRKLHDGQINKLRELEGVRQQFKNSRFDDVRSGFANADLVSSVLSQFVQGVITGADLWGTIKRNQRHRNGGAAPDFGSGGLGELMDALGQNGAESIGDILGPAGSTRRRRRQRQGSPWHIPRPRRNGDGFQFPRSSGRRGSSSDTGFKTGGGF